MKSKLDSLLEKGGGLLRTEEVLSAGVSRMELSALVKRGILERVAHGVYGPPGELYDELYVLQLRSERLVFSFGTALWLNGLTDRAPLEYDVTVPTGAPLGRLLRGECRCHYVKPGLFELGLTVRQTMFRYDVRCYDAERTICDLVRCEPKVGVEALVGGLKAYAASPKKDIPKLMEMAQAFSIESEIARYMGVLV